MNNMMSDLHLRQRTTLKLVAIGCVSSVASARAFQIFIARNQFEHDLAGEERPLRADLHYG